MHERSDAPGTHPDKGRRLLIGGLDEVWTRHEAQREWKPSHV
jgi:hypothetical protein